MTSFKVVAIIRKLTGEKKAGHLGTLDPDAEGVLPVCLGKATKLMGLLEDKSKVYNAVMQLGISTDTQDITGSVISKCEPVKLEDSDIQNAFRHFTGEIEQIPPMYSAVKVNGVKLVDAARKGKDIERKSRKVTIFSYEAIAYDPDTNSISFTVRCSKGTYIRTLCQDIGEYLGMPACMKSLIRTETAGLTTDNAYTLDEIRTFAEESTLADHIIPLDTMLMDRPAIYAVSQSVDKRLYMGNYLEPCEVDTMGSDIADHGSLRIYDSQGDFTALYYYDNKDNLFKCEKMLK